MEAVTCPHKRLIASKIERLIYLRIIITLWDSLEILSDAAQQFNSTPRFFEDPLIEIHHQLNLWSSFVQVWQAFSPKILGDSLEILSDAAHKFNSTPRFCEDPLIEIHHQLNLWSSFVQVWRAFSPKILWDS